MAARMAYQVDAHDHITHQSAELKSINWNAIWHYAISRKISKKSRDVLSVYPI